MLSQKNIICIVYAWEAVRDCSAMSYSNKGKTVVEREQEVRLGGEDIGFISIYIGD